MDEDQGECDATDEFILKMAHSSNNLFPGNSFELNSATLSDDSGFVPHTNSSISSGSSRGVGLCRFEFEVICNYKGERCSWIFFKFCCFFCSWQKVMLKCRNLIH